MATNYSKFLSLISGAERTVDLSLSTNVLELGGGGLQMDGSTSGHVVISASATTTTYSMIWPATQAASSNYVLTNDGTGVLSWAPPAATGVTAVSIASANGFTGSSSGGSTPALTIATSVTGILYGNGTSVAAAVAGNFPTLNQNTTGSAASFTGSLSGDVTGTQSATVLSATSNATLATLSGLTSAINLASVGTITTGTWHGSVIGYAYGGTNASSQAAAQANMSPMTTAGDLTYENSTPAPARLPIGSTGQVLTVVGGLPAWSSPATSGTVTSVSVVSANGLAGTVATATSTPAITLSTTVTGILQGNGTAISAAPTTGSGNVVLSASPTLTGTLSAATASFSSAISLGGNQINNLATPTLSTDAANKSYVDAAISGLTWEGPAKAYAASNVPLTGSTPLVIDGYTVLNNDLVILGNQTTASQNGEYSVAISGGSYVLTANGLPSAAGDAWLILNGTVYAHSAFVANAAVPSATFTEFAGPTAYTFNAPLSLSGNTVSISQATTSTNGYLTSTDWNTFNNKQAAGNYITALTGDGTASGPGSAAFTLATVNSNVGTFASVTVNGKGLVTGASALSGDATTSGAVITLATVNSNTGSFGSSTSIPTITVNGKGLITAVSGNAVIAPAGTLSGTALNSTVVSSSLTSVGTISTGVWNGTAIGPTFGGTGITAYTTGDILYASATNTLSKLGIGSSGNVLTVVGGVPTWAAPATGGTVTSVSVVSANGFTGTVATATSTPAITIATSVTGILQGNGTAISAASTTGTGSVVLATSPTLVTPALGTPSAAVLTNATGLPLTTGVTGTLPIANGGTNATSAAAAFNNLSPLTTTGDLIYEASAGTAGRLGVGTTGQVLTVAGGVPTWASPAAGTGISTSEVAGQALSATTLVALRYELSSDAGTAGQMWKADNNAATTDNFYVIGLAYPAAGVSIGGAVTVTEMGIINVPSHGFTPGLPLFLGSSGALTTTAPSSAGLAVVRVGQVKDANNIWVNIQVVGVN